MMFYPSSPVLVTPILSNSSLQGFECLTRNEEEEEGRTLKEEEEEGRTVKEEKEEKRGDDGMGDGMGEEGRGVKDFWEEGRRTVEIFLLSKLLVGVLRRSGLGGVTSLKHKERNYLL